MRIIVFSNGYKKDIKAYEHNKDLLEEIGVLINKLAKDEPLEQKYDDHKLVGGLYPKCRDSHVRPNVALIYYKPKGTNVLELIRIGPHNKLKLTSSLNTSR